ncbi:dihydrodipicolinate synthase family protein [uncultured Sphingomonas sp.]|uniref:dihydrodipicolinate synthase family protein n=1 Tax=uncultured Sphingomonas sp. TaxID=158754 RepID=UPI0025EB75E9|nr:dihydrodipicolinate synthase family protein [uncultured Sphingomonas sp.]
MAGTLFTGLCAFPLTPADSDGVVNTRAFAALIDRLCVAGVDSIGILGSTGLYAYLDRAERVHAVHAAVEAVAGRVPLIVGIGALRTSWSVELAREAERAGAQGLLLAPMSYTPLTVREVAGHYRAVAGATALPLCIYNNPGTTGFTFPDALIGELAHVPGIAAIKMPLPEGDDFAGEIGRLRKLVPQGFRIGYSGDWGAAPSLLAGGAAWYSVVAGLLPVEALRMTRAAQNGAAAETARLQAAFEPLWRLFQAHGSLRLMYGIAERLNLDVEEPPLPIQKVDAPTARALDAALDQLINA